MPLQVAEFEVRKWTSGIEERCYVCTGKTYIVSILHGKMLNVVVIVGYMV